MATITFTVSENHAAALAAQAEAEGLTLEEWLRRLAEREVPPTSRAHLQKTDPDEWLRQLQAAIARLPPMPPISDEAMSRESIYFGED